VDIYDTDGIQMAEPVPTLAFEAGWGTDGATCVSKTRLPDVFTLDAIRQTCPERLGDLLGTKCDEASARRDPRTLLMNKS
jgi:hypothetical protein